MDHESSVAPDAAAEPTGPTQPTERTEPARAPAPSPLRKRSLWPLVALLTVVVVGLAVALIVVRGTADDRPRAAVGQVFSAPFAEDDLPHYGEVLLPWARTKTGAGAAREELPDLLGAKANVRAPEGGRFVRVEVKLEKDYIIPLSAVGRPYTQKTEVVLRADGRDYPVSGRDGLVLDPNGPLQQGGGVWVAVEGDPKDLEVRVTTDGVSQVLDASDGSVEAGRAADLAEIPSQDELREMKGASCGTPTRLDDSGLRVDYRPSLKCRVQLALHTPYVDGLGWSDEGREFLVVHVVRPRRLSLISGRGDAATYWDAELEFSALLGDAEPLGPAMDVNDLNSGPLSISDPDDPEQLVFDVAQGEPMPDLTFDYQGQATTGGPFTVERRPIHFHWTLPGGDLS